MDVVMPFLFFGTSKRKIRSSTEELALRELTEYKLRERSLAARLDYLETERELMLLRSEQEECSN